LRYFAFESPPTTQEHALEGTLPFAAEYTVSAATDPRYPWVPGWTYGVEFEPCVGGGMAVGAVVGVGVSVGVCVDSVVVPGEEGTEAPVDDPPSGLTATAARFHSSLVGAVSLTETEVVVDGAVNRCAQKVSLTRVSTL